MASFVTQLTAASSKGNQFADALYHLKCSPTIVWIRQTDHVSASGAFSATATFYSATCIHVVLYTCHCNGLSYRTASFWCLVSLTCNTKVSRTCVKQTFNTTNVVDVKWR